MSATRRLKKELEDVKQIDSDISPFFCNVQVDEANILHWEGILVPDKDPYASKGLRKGFRIEMNFPPEYPFKPPKVLFKTKIYHPNISEEGQVCLPIITAENWKPATKAHQIILALKSLIEEPEPSAGPLRGDVAEVFTKNKDKFNATAQEYVQKYAELVQSPDSAAAE
ncbi:ubiquitin-conjugating enzyme E2 L3-like [Symsagittifera roscoffensis]|uniref:ubiquitin-conjugating enzyme E2 L3-like n=1 Tax=Symsagittifera roscoffensis TaxID=84072 RepID=UPI00307C4BBA